MSVGHVARALEGHGIATVIIAIRAFEQELHSMHVPRLVTTPFPMGRPLGMPNDPQGQRAVILAALELLGAATGPQSVRRVDCEYLPDSS